MCLDSSEKGIIEAQKQIEQLKTDGLPYPERCSYFLEDAVYLPFENDSIDEIVLSNTISAPIHHNWEHNKNILKIENKTKVIERPLLGPENELDLFYRERKPLINECMRVLKPNGRISIYTDLIIYGIDSYERILAEMSEHPDLMKKIDKVEQKRIDDLNKNKLKNKKFCFCFDAEVLPRSEIIRFIKSENPLLS